MSRGGYKIVAPLYENGEYELGDSSCPNWLESLAVQLAERDEEKALTAVEVARRRNDAPSVFDQMHAIMNGSVYRTPYTSVDEAVRDYAKRTGLDEYRKRALAQQIMDAPAEEEIAEEDTEKKNSLAPAEKPALLERLPLIENYIHNFIDTNRGAQIPAILYNIGVLFRRDGVTESDLDDADLARYINDLIGQKANLSPTDDPRLGRYIGIFNEDLGIDNPWAGLQPARRI